MSDPQTFLAFGAVMVVIAMLAIAVDWVGKPLRHRKFVPKIYRFPEERMPRGSSVRATEWSDRSFVLPVADVVPPDLRFGDQALGQVASGVGSVFDQDDLRGLPDGAATGAPGSPGGAASVFAIDDGPPTAAVDPVAPTVVDEAPPTPVVDRRRRGWSPGAFVFNLTDDGEEPTPAVVRERYWRNVAATSGAAMFGADNVDRMSVGRPPRRRNPRTGRIESMTLPAASHRDLGGRTPVPSWPGDELDPFAS